MKRLLKMKNLIGSEWWEKQRILLLFIIAMDNVSHNVDVNKAK